MDIFTKLKWNARSHLCVAFRDNHERQEPRRDDEGDDVDDVGRVVAPDVERRARQEVGLFEGK
jgi:hypothetical protein